MTPSEIHEALNAIRATFPQSSKMFLAFVELADKTGVLGGSTQRGSVIAMKNAWQLENKAPTVSFLPTDEKVIDYVRKAAGDAEKTACKLMVVIDMPSNSTNVWNVPKGACFVATAACGNPFAPEVVILSSFRDDVLLRGRIGRAFVRLYYFGAPPLAALISHSAWLRRASMILLVKPAVRAVRAFRLL